VRQAEQQTALADQAQHQVMPEADAGDAGADAVVGDDAGRKAQRTVVGVQGQQVRFDARTVAGSTA